MCAKFIDAFRVCYLVHVREIKRFVISFKRPKFLVRIELEWNCNGMGMELLCNCNESVMNL